MSKSIRNSLLLLAVIGPFYVAIIGTCCDKCESTQTCWNACYSKVNGDVCAPPENTYAHMSTGVECAADAQGIPKYCSQGLCLTNVCKGKANLTSCAKPNSGSGGAGICINERCFPVGGCLVPNYGRINCCEGDCSGSTDASGARCNPALHTPDNTVCDPTGEYPAGHASAAGGACQNGFCQPNSQTVCLGADPSNEGRPTCVAGAYSSEFDCLGYFCDPNSAASPCTQVDLGDGAFPRCLSGPCDSGTCSSTGQPCPPAVAELCDDDNVCTNDRCIPGKVDMTQDTSDPAAMCPDNACCIHTPNEEMAGHPCSPAGGSAETGICRVDGACLPVMSSSAVAGGTDALKKSKNKPVAPR